MFNHRDLRVAASLKPVASPLRKRLKPNHRDLRVAASLKLLQRRSLKRWLRLITAIFGVAASLKRNDPHNACSGDRLSPRSSGRGLIEAAPYRWIVCRFLWYHRDLRVAASLKRCYLHQQAPFLHYHRDLRVAASLKRGNQARE